MALLLVDPPARAPRSRGGRLPWAPMPATATAVALTVVAARTGGPTGLVAVLGAFGAACRALDRALPYHDGLRDHRQ